MTRLEFVKAVAEKLGYTQKSIKEVLDVMQKVAYKGMAQEEEVKIFDGVTLVGVHKEARTARNPITGETIQVEAKITPKAKFGKACKDALNA